MNFRRRMLSRMREGDRAAVELLRGASSHGTPGMHSDFTVFRERLREAGLQILDPDALILGEDEGHVLGWLAAVQRQRLEPAIESWRIATAEAQICAEHLNQLGYRIDYNRVVTTQTSDFLSRLMAAGWTDISGPPSVSDTRRAVMRALEEKGPMRTIELATLGATRQALSRMVKQGLIRRLRYGVYASPPRLEPPKA